MLKRVWRALLDFSTVLSFCGFVAIGVLWMHPDNRKYLLAIDAGNVYGRSDERTRYFAQFDKFGAVVWRTADSEHRFSCPRLMLIASIVPALRFAFWTRSYLRTRRREASGQCLQCGYDMRASPGRCPECGTEPQKS